MGHFCAIAEPEPKERIRTNAGIAAQRERSKHTDERDQAAAKITPAAMSTKLESLSGKECKGPKMREARKKRKAAATEVNRLANEGV